MRYLTFADRGFEVAEQFEHVWPTIVSLAREAALARGDNAEFVYFELTNGITASVPISPRVPVEFAETIGDRIDMGRVKSSAVVWDASGSASRV